MRLLLMLAIAAPLLRPAPPNLETRFQTDGRTISVVLKNVASSAAVAYNGVVESAGSGKRKPKPTSEWMSFDTLFDTGEIAIAPQGERTIPAKSLRPRSAPTARTAVLYEDGSTAGDPDDVRRLLDVRQASLADIPHIRMLIRGSMGAGALRLELEKLNKRNLKPPTPALKRHTPKDEKRKAKDMVRLHYAGSRVPAVVLQWMEQTANKDELMTRLDEFQERLEKAPK